MFARLFLEVSRGHASLSACEGFGWPGAEDLLAVPEHLIEYRGSTLSHKRRLLGNLLPE